MTDERASTGATRSDGAGGGDPDGVDAPPIDAPPIDVPTTDRPYVDGRAASPEQLRAEVGRLSFEERQHVDDLREEVGESIAALAARLDVKSRVAERRDDAVAAVQQKVDRARVAAVDGASTAKDTVRERPGVIAGAVGALLALLVVVIVRRRRG